MRDQSEDKKNILKYLSTTPIISVAIQRAGVVPATYYRWRNDDKQFALAVRKAMKRGKTHTDDYVFGKFMKMIDSGNLRATIYYLDRCHPWFKKKQKVIDLPPSSVTNINQYDTPPEKGYMDIDFSKLPKRLRKQVRKHAVHAHEGLVDALKESFGDKYAEWMKKMPMGEEQMYNSLGEVMNKGILGTKYPNEQGSTQESIPLEETDPQ